MMSGPPRRPSATGVRPAVRARPAAPGSSGGRTWNCPSSTFPARRGALNFPRHTRSKSGVPVEIAWHSSASTLRARPMWRRLRWRDTAVVATEDLLVGRNLACDRVRASSAEGSAKPDSRLQSDLLAPGSAAVRGDRPGPHVFGPGVPVAASPLTGLPPRHTAMDEGTLVRRAAEGDRHAFGILVRAHQEGVYRWIRRLVNDDEAARDLTQDTFLRSFRALSGFRGEAAFGTWLRTIAANVARSHLRHEAGRQLVPLDAELASEAPPPDAGLATAEARVALAHALERLPPRQREVVMLRVWSDLPYAEIARRVGSSENAAKVNFHHAIKRLRRLLGETPAAAPGP